MPQRQIFTVEIDGRQYDIEGDRPPSEAEARAAVGLAAPMTQPARRLGSAKTGGAANSDASAPDWGAFFSHLGQSAVDTVNPMTYLRTGKALLTTPPWTSGANLLRGVRDTAGNLVNGNFSATAGDLAGPAAAGGVLSGVAKGSRMAAPKVMELGLQRTKAERLDFPNTAQRLVDDGIIPTKPNVQKALDTVEGKINTDAAAYDAANPLHRVDPDTLAAAASDFARREGRVGGLGNVPGPESAEIDALQRRYLDQNTRTRGQAETIEQKRAYAARSRYNNRPNAPTVTNNEINFNKGIAAGNRAAAVKNQPTLAADLAKEQDLLGALVAAENNAAKGMPNTLIGAGKSIAFGPRLTGNTAWLLDRTGRGLQRMTPEMMRAAFAQLLASQQANRGE